MRRALTLGLLPALLLSSVCAREVVAEQGTLRWDYTGSEAERIADGDSLRVSVRVGGLDAVKLQELIYSTARYVSRDSSVVLPLEDTLCVAGKRRYKVLDRQKHLRNVRSGQPGEGVVLPVKSLGDTTLLLEAAFPFDRPMAEGYILVDERIYACAECERSERWDTVARVNIPIFSEPDYRYDFREPERVLVKTYDSRFDCQVSFPSARHDLLLGFEDNRRELVRLGEFVAESMTIPGADLREVYIRGYASPEGEYNYNKKLSDRRTQTLATYALKRYPQLKKAAVYESSGEGEDWDGLKRAVAASQMPWRTEVTAIIDRYNTDTEREEALRALEGGTVYATLLRDFYPNLRRTTFCLRFVVRPYTMEEIPEMFHLKPEGLSQHEMFRLVQLREQQGEDPMPVYRKAYEQFAPDPIAMLNYANALLKYEGDADSALQVLQSLEDDPRAWLPMAIAYDMKGDWRRADKLARKWQAQE